MATRIVRIQNVEANIGPTFYPYEMSHRQMATAFAALVFPPFHIGWQHSSGDENGDAGMDKMHTNVGLGLPHNVCFCPFPAAQHWRGHRRRKSVGQSKTLGF